MDNTIHNDVTAAVVQQSGSDQVKSKVQAQESPRSAESSSSTFRLLARINNSTRLSSKEKNILAGSVQTIENYAQGALKSKLLSDVTSVTLFIESHGVVSQSARKPIVAKVDVAPQAAPVAKAPAKNPAVALAREVRQNLEQAVQSVAPEKTFGEAVAEISRESAVQEVLALGSGVSVEETTFEVQDIVVLGAGTGGESNVILPGSGDVDLELAAEIRQAEEFSLPEIDFQPLPLPGQSGDLAGIELPGGETVVQVQEATAQPVELKLPGEAAIRQFTAEDLQTSKPTTVTFA